jgi:hypothetical protein
MTVSQADDACRLHIHEITTFPVATAMVLRETVMRFERTVPQMTENRAAPIANSS